MAIICGILAAIFILGVYHGYKNPPTKEEIECARENRKKAAQIATVATVTTAHKLVTTKEKKKY